MRGHSFRPFGGTIAVIGSDECRDDASCFADEVVVDFPSVAPAVDRMRRGLEAEQRVVSLRTALQLSAREAREGATVPVAVPVRCTCHRCGGRGETWAERCGHCAGTGTELLRHHLQVSVPPGVTDGARFHFTLTPRHNPPTRIELRVLVA